MPPPTWLAPIKRPIVSMASPFVPDSGNAMETAPAVVMRRMRAGGGLLPPPISETWMAPSNQTAPSMFPKLLPLLLKESRGGTPAIFVGVMLDGLGAVNGPAGQV